MASLLDYLTQNSQSGLLGSLWPQQRIDRGFSAFPQDRTLLSPQQRIGQGFNATNASPLGAPPLPPTQDVAQPPQDAMPVSMPTGASASAGVPPQQTAPQGGGFMSGLGNFINNNPLTLMALGGGIAQHGIGGFATAAPVAAQEMALNRQNLSQAATYHALIAAGVPEGTARAIALNPAAAKDFMPQLKETQKDPFSGKTTYGAFNPLTGQPIAGAGGSGSSVSPGDVPPQYDENGRDEAFLASLGPERAAGVKAITEGRLPATGRNLQQLMVDAARYEVGFDQNVFNGRRTLINDLAKSTPGSAGGQITFARTSLRHLDEVASAAEALKNTDTGFVPLNTAINSIRSMNSTQQAKVKALQDAAQHYGQEVTKFYAGSPGGEAERQRFLTSLGAASSPQELAAVIAQEKALIPERLSELQNRIDSTLKGQAHKYPTMSPQAQDAMNSIDTKVTRMRGLTSPAAAPAAPAGVIRWEKGPDGKPRPMVQQ